MQAVAFNRDALAGWYAREHLQVDPGLRAVYYLRSDAPDREIRLLEVNDLIAERDDDALEPLDFGVDIGSGGEHKLFVLDVTPAQWGRIERSALPLPPGWSLLDAQLFRRP